MDDAGVHVALTPYQAPNANAHGPRAEALPVTIADQHAMAAQQAIRCGQRATDLALEELVTNTVAEAAQV